MSELKFLAVVWLVALIGGWWMARRLARVKPVWRFAVVCVLVFLASLIFVDKFDTWSFVAPVGDASGDLSSPAYLILILVLWHSAPKSKTARMERLLGTALLGIGILTPFVFLGPILGAVSNGPRISNGRIDAKTSYSVTERSNLFGSTFASYSIYRNPRWFPLIHRRISSGPIECWQRGDSAGIRPSPGSGALIAFSLRNGMEHCPAYVVLPQ
jgi:hypothetical protein